MQVLTAGVEDKVLLDFNIFDIEDLLHNRLFLRQKSGSQKYVSDKTIAAKNIHFISSSKIFNFSKIERGFLSLKFIKK